MATTEELKQAALAAKAALDAAQQLVTTRQAARDDAAMDLDEATANLNNATADLMAKKESVQAAYAAHRDSTTAPLYKGVNDVLVPMTDAEIAEELARREASEAQAVAQAKHYLVPKLVIIRRLIAAGKLTTALDALDANRELKAQWDAASEVYADDPLATGFMTAIGANVEEILAKE